MNRNFSTAVMILTLALFVAPARATVVGFAWTNSSTGLLDTNDFVIIPKGQVRNADGTFNFPGQAFRVHNPFGATNYWLTGPQYYQITNRIIGDEFYIRTVDSSSNLVMAGDKSIYMGGANPWVELVISPLATNAVSATFATNAGTAFAIDRAATNQVNAQALSVAQGVVNTNVPLAANSLNPGTQSNVIASAVTTGSHASLASVAIPGQPDSMNLFGDGGIYGSYFALPNSHGTFGYGTLGYITTDGTNTASWFIGNGAGLTGLNPSALTGGIVVTNIVLRPNGTNDQTAAIQSAFSTQNSVVYFTPGQYYATNLWMTSNVTVYGNGSTLYQLAAVSQGFAATNTDWINNTNWNALVNCGVGNPNQRIYGLVLDGMKPDAYQAYNFPIWTGVNNGFYTMAADGNHAATNNIGLLIDMASGGEISGCTAQNFGGCGFFISSSQDQNSYQSKSSAFHDNRAYTNYCGFYVQAWGGTHPSIFGNAEYSLLSDLSGNNCSVGIDDGASNGQLGDSTFNYCYIAFANVGGNGNSGPHSRYHDLTLNHDYMGIWAGANNDFAGFDNVYEAATSTNIIKDRTVIFRNCDLGGVWIDGQGANYNLTNNWVQFNGGELIFSSTSNNVDVKNCILLGKCSWQGCNLNDFNNVPTGTLLWTNWFTDVFTNYGGGSYSGNGGQTMMGSPGNGSYVQTYVLATNQISFTTVPTNSAISLTLSRGTWQIEARLFESSVSGYNGWFRADITFTNLAISSTVEDFINDWSSTGVGMNGNWTINQGDFPGWRSGMSNLDQFNSPDFGVNKFEGIVVATNNWCATVRFWPLSTGTNQLWPGSYLTATRIAP